MLSKSQWTNIKNKVYNRKRNRCKYCQVLFFKHNLSRRRAMLVGDADSGQLNIAAIAQPHVCLFWPTASHRTSTYSYVLRLLHIYLYVYSMSQSWNFRSKANKNFKKCYRTRKKILKKLVIPTYIREICIQVAIYNLNRTVLSL